MTEKNIVTQSCVLSDALDLKIWFWGLKTKFMDIYYFLKNNVTSEGVVSHKVLYYQPLPITRFQVMFYANDYFE